MASDKTHFFIDQLGHPALSLKLPALSQKVPLGTMGGRRDTRPPAAVTWEVEETIHARGHAVRRDDC